MKLNIYLTILTIIISYKSVAQPCTDTEEYFRKRHQVNGMTYGHPYTIFDRHNGKSINLTLQDIRANIVSGSNAQSAFNSIFKAYELVYQNAISTMPSDDGLKTNFGNVNSYSQKAIWAKNNAFIFLVGLNANGQRLDSLDPTYQTRNDFRDRALMAFDNLTGVIQPHEAFAIYLSNTDDSNMQHYCRSLILWLQTYDLLKGAYEEDSLRTKSRNPYGFGDADRNGPNCSPRQKLRQLTRDFYTRCKDFDGIVEHSAGWKKNHGIACASALLMAAQVLNDAGVETSFIGGFFGWIIGKGPWPKPKYSPIKWNELGQKGLEDNLFEGWHMAGFRNVPVAPKNTNPNDFSPYTEGPAYAIYGLIDCGVPAMRAQQNLYPNWSNEPFLKKNEILNIFNWLNEITVNNSLLPTYDNSHTRSHCSQLAIVDGKYYYGETERLDQNLVDFIAFIGGNNLNINKNPKVDELILPETGNIILRGETGESKYYFHMLAEKGSAIDKVASTSDGSHEDDDLGSFMIYAWDKFQKNPNYLAIDPPYLGWNNDNKAMETNRYWLHNTIEINDGQDAITRDYHGPNITINPTLISGTDNSKRSFDLSFGYLNTDYPANFQYDLIKRNVNEIKSGNNFYYLMNDYIDATSIALNVSMVQLNLNGNGDINQFEGENPFKSRTFRKEGNLFMWTHPCGRSDSSSNYRLIYHISALNNNISAKEFSEHFHSSSAYNSGGSLHESGLQTICYNNSDGRGQHTRLQIKQPVKKTIFQSFLFPQKCNGSLPTVTKVETSSFVSTRIRFINGYDTTITNSFFPSSNPSNLINDTSSHFHYSRFIGMESDSVQNPFNLPNQSNNWIYLDGQKVFIQHHTESLINEGFRYCPPSFIKIRYAEFLNGSFIKFNDTFLIQSTISVDAQLGFSGKHTYTAFVKPNIAASSVDSITFYLADVARGTDMVAIKSASQDTIPGRYDSLTNMMHLAIPQQATGFSIIQKDLCSDCYFPPVGTNFDTLFVANDGLKHILGNSKKITSNHGQVKITNSTRIEMCPSVILHNTDSIIVEGPPQSEPMNIPSCGGVDNLKKYSKNSMLVVSPYAALVLDANSKTYIKNGAGLYIKQNGSLVVKSGALLEIGDSGSAGYGEFYADAGAFVYIEPGATIRYRRAIADTIDRNYMIFGMNSGGVVAGLPYQIDSVLKADSIIPSYNTALAICDLDSLNPIGNKQWGYTNFGKPEAKFFTRSLNLCEGEPFHISLKRMLNDATLKIKVCKMDSILVPDGYGSHVWKYRCLQDSLVLDSVPPDPTCLLPRISPDEWTWYFPANTLHRVQITVTNECGKMHDTTVLVRVLDSAQISLSAPTIACEGIGTVKVIPSLNQSGNVKYVFELSEVLDSSNAEQLLSNPAQEYSYQQTGILPDTFSFPGMYFKGGRKYMIAFSYISNCGVVTVEKEVNIPTGAFIKSEKPTTFANPLHGARSVQLHGYISLADSFKWSPNTYLNRTDTLVVISTPEDPINYVLQAYYGSCTASDTIEIKYNRIANAGEADTVCFGGNEILVGNAYDASMFLAYLYYKGGSEFRDEFIDETTNDNAYFQDFTRFMHTTAFKDWLINCGSLNEEFTEDLMKEICIKKPWYRTYFKQLNEFNDADMPALDGFVSNLNADSILRLNFINTGDWTNIKSCIPEVFARYDNFKSSSVNDYSISWTRISGDDTLQLTHYSNLALTIDSPWQTSIYIQQAITPYYAEFDETITYVDTITQAAFLVAMQMDSTVFFENISTPESNSSSYTWNFGDGTTSTNKHAIHTFPKFDTSYLVCLSVSNHCGTYSWCDTIFIDSAHWNQLDKRVHLNKNKKEETINIHLLNLEALLYPNPTESNALLVYKLEEENFEGKLVITDIGGRSIWESDLKQKSGNIKIPSQHWHDGLYFFHLQTSSGTKTGKFIVRH